MNGASGPNMTQVVKPVSKYKKQASNAFQLPLFNEATTCFIWRFPKIVPLGHVSATKKKPPTHGSIDDPYELAALPRRQSGTACAQGIMQRLCHSAGRYWDAICFKRLAAILPPPFARRMGQMI
jgi:hypothetical protein